MTEPSAFRTTLLRWADTDDQAERRRVAGVLASQIELALNQQGNNAQVVIWDVEEKLNTKIDGIHEQIGNANTLSSAVLEAVNGLRADVAASAVESAARLGKIEQRLDRKRDELDDHERRLRLIEDQVAELRRAHGHGEH